MTRKEATVIKAFRYVRPFDGTTVLITRGTRIQVEIDGTAWVYGDNVDISLDEYAIDDKGVIYNEQNEHTIKGNI